MFFCSLLVYGLLFMEESAQRRSQKAPAVWSITGLMHLWWRHSSLAHASVSSILMVNAWRRHLHHSVLKSLESTSSCRVNVLYNFVRHDLVFLILSPSSLASITHIYCRDLFCVGMFCYLQDKPFSVSFLF